MGGLAETLKEVGYKWVDWLRLGVAVSTGF